MTALGIPPPPDLTERPAVAAWFLEEVETAYAAGDAARVQDLISGAIDAGVVGQQIPAVGFAHPQQLSTLLAPYRRDLAGEERARTDFLRTASAGARPATRRSWSWWS